MIRYLNADYAWRSRFEQLLFISLYSISQVFSKLTILENIYGIKVYFLITEVLQI